MRLHALVIALIAVFAASPSHAARYTYHGDLMDGGMPASGTYELRVTSYGRADSAVPLAAPLELSNVNFVDGSFAVELDLPDSATGTTWVQVALRKSGSSVPYETLGSPQPIVNVNSGCPFSWSTDGNTALAAGSFLGIADPASAAPLVLKARNSGVATFTPGGTLGSYGDAPQVSMGSSANVASAVGATIAGGGSSLTSGGSACPTCANKASAAFATIGGGQGNVASGTHAGVSSGETNSASAAGAHVAGGKSNAASGTYAAIGGGEVNTARDQYATVGGGNQNDATGQNATIAGGYSGQASGNFAMVPGGLDNCAGGDNSFAAGRFAQVRTHAGAPVACSGTNSSGDADGDEGSFVWADVSGGYFVTTGPNQFLIRADGGVGINTAPPDGNVELTIASDNAGDFASLWLKQKAASNAGVMLTAGDATGANNSAFYIDHYNGSALARRLALNADGSVYIRSNTTAANSGVTMAANGGSWSSLSDRNVKTAISTIDPGKILDRLLATPISTWSYIAQGEGIRHIGPMAQDFAAAFKVGEDDTHISTIDADGVALAAIQGLNAKLETENAALRTELHQLLTRLERLEGNQGR